MNYTLLFANNANTTLANPVSSIDTQITVASGTGSIFPAPSTNQAVVLTLVSATNSLITEIVWCTAISGDTLTILRGQEGTTARAWNAGDYVANLITAGTNENFIQIYQLENPTYNAQFLNVSATTGQIINAPVNPTDITNKNYVDTLVASGIIPNPLTFGTGLVSGSYNGKTAVTINVDETVIATLSTAQTLTNKSISGALNTLSAIPNSALDYSSITINGVSIALGGSNNITANTSNLLYSGTGLAGGPFNGSSPVTISIAPSGVIAGTYGSVNTVPSITVNTEGQVTNIALDPIAISNSQVSGLGTLSTQNANNVNITGGSISGTSIGLGNPSSIDATTVNATLFSGSGAGLTGIASGLSIGGSSATSNASSNILGGGAYQIPYQISSGNTSFINAPSVADTYLFWNGTSYSWQSVSAGSVTSVSASGGLTGLTFTGSPITTAGTLTLGGILNVESGGTGANSLTGYVYGNGTGALTASTSIPNTAISGLGTMSTQYANNVNITGGNISGVVVSLESINNTPIGNLIPSTGAFTTLSSTGLANLNTLSTISATISSGEIDNSIIGQLIPNKAYFTTLSANGTLTLSSYTGYLYGNGSGFVTASTTIPTSALSGTVNSNQLTPTGVTAGTYGSSAVIPVLTVNAEGQITSISVQATNAPAYQGTWNASTNTPTLTSGVGTQGYYYVVSVAGNTTLDGVSGWNVGDWAIFENGHWEKIPGSTSESFTNLTTTNLAVTGLTGYMYANGSGNVTASMTVPTSVLSGTVNSNQLTPTGVTAGSYTYGSFTVNAEGQLTLASSNPTTGSGNIVLSNSPTITGAWGSPDSLQFNTAATVTPTVGKLYWDGGSSLNIGMTTQTVQSIGEDQFIYVKATSAITAGQSIMFTGAVGASGVLTAAPATGVTKASYIMGVACENIPVNGFGLIQTFGLIQNLNTSAYAQGTVLYYDSSTVGGLTSVEPVAPNIKVQLAAVVNQGTGNGSIFVRRQESGTINNITEIQVTSPLNYNLLQYNGTIWQNVASLNGVPIGNIYPTTGVFTSLTASTSTLGTATASSLNSTPIGNTTPSTGAFTTLSTTGLATLNSLSTSNATITGGSISNVALTLDSVNNTPIGNVTPSSGAFTTLSTTGLATLNSLSTANATITGGSITGVSLTLDSLNSTPIGNTTPSTGAFTNVYFGLFDITQSGSKLYFAYNGTNIASLDTSGNLIVSGNVTTHGTP